MPLSKLALIRTLRLYPLRARRTRIPAQRQPDMIRASYYSALLPFVEVMQATMEAVVPRIMKLLEDERRAQGKTDAEEKPPKLEWTNWGGDKTKQETTTVEFKATDPKGRQMGVSITIQEWEGDPEASNPKFRVPGVRTLVSETREGQGFGGSKAVSHVSVEEARAYAERIAESKRQEAEAGEARIRWQRAKGEEPPPSARAAEATALVDRASKAALEMLRPRQIEEVAAKFGKRTSEFQREQLNRQVEAAFSVPLSAIEPSVTMKLEGFAAENAALIQGVSQRYFERVKGDVVEAFARGTHPSELADMLRERDGMSENDAERIARDQIGKLNAQFNQERQEQMGVTGYIWRTTQDNRVRDNHDALEGQRFEWSDPPMGGGTSPDEPGHPGSGIQCRCYAEPDFGPIMEGLEE